VSRGETLDQHVGPLDQPDTSRYRPILRFASTTCAAQLLTVESRRAIGPTLHPDDIGARSASDSARVRPWADPASSTTRIPVSGPCYRVLLQ